jgi:large subunit ribosomal protein L19
MNWRKEVEKDYLKKEITSFNPGDTIKVFFKLREGNKVRTQAFEGTVISKKHHGLRETFTVRRICYGIGVERTFLLHSPTIEKIDLLSRGKVRRAKLYYLRQKKGKETKVKTIREK